MKYFLHPRVCRLMLLLIAGSHCSMSQDFYNKEASKEVQKKEKLQAKNPKADSSLSVLYIGTSTGINNYSGMIGIGANIRLQNTFFLRLGAGAGGWGSKLTAGIKYDQKTKSCWGYALTLSRCSGLKSFETDLDVYQFGIVQKKKVQLDLLAVHTANISAIYNWYFRKNKLFYLEAGYSFPLNSNTYKVNDGSVLTETSKQAMQFLEPGGICLAIGFLFGN